DLNFDYSPNGRVISINSTPVSVHTDLLDKLLKSMVICLEQLTLLAFTVDPAGPVDAHYRDVRFYRNPFRQNN
ncbi:hypothetical protein, partial [Shewanella mangrovisoli]|uniref:hypothetical protein n=1 Tax=Shewanella mangrovisoli TaxID=2864211 RepID=UPI0035BB0D99